MSENLKSTLYNWWFSQIVQFTITDIDIGICGDAKLAAEAISAHLQNLSPACLETTDARIQKAQDIRAQWEDELSSMSVSTEDRMAPRHALRELEKAMPKVSKKKN